MTNDSKKNPVIAQLLPALENGGVERGTIDIAKALKKTDFEPIVISSGGVLTYQLKEAQIKHINLSANSKNPLTIFFNIKKLVKIIEENHIDLLHVRSRAPMWSAYFACKKTGTKLLSTVHGTYSLKFWRWSCFWPKKVYNEMMLKASRIIAVSGFIKDYILENYTQQTPQQSLEENRLELATKITVIARGADLSYFDASKVSTNRIIDLSKKWNLPEDKKIILMPARFTAWKGHEFLLEVLSQVRSEFCCVMVGSDHGHKKFRKKIEARVTEKKLEGKVKVVGICKDMPAAYAIAHLVVCPSVRPEAFGRIAIEAQASNKIIIATKIGGALETIIDEKTGFLVDVEDVTKFAARIDQVLEMSKTDADKIGAAARHHVEKNFSGEKMCRETISLYREMIAS